MKGFLKLLFVVVCGCALAICLLGVVLVGVLHLEPNHVLQKMNLNKALYLLLLVILAECCFFANDLLAYISQRFDKRLWFDFSEIKFRYDLDNYNRAIPLGSKLSQLYPITVAIVLAGLAVLVAK